MLVPFHRHEGRNVEPRRLQARQNAGVNVGDRHHHRRHVGVVRLLYAHDLAQRSMVATRLALVAIFNSFIMRTLKR